MDVGMYDTRKDDSQIGTRKVPKDDLPKDELVRWPKIPAQVENNES